MATAELIRDNIKCDNCDNFTDPVLKLITYDKALINKIYRMSTNLYNDIDDFADVFELLYTIADFQGLDRSLIESKRIELLNDGKYSQCKVKIVP